MAEKKAELFVLSFRAHYSDETEDTVGAAEENDFDHPESMASENFKLDTAEAAVVKQQKAITKQAKISSEHFEVTEPVLSRRGVPPQGKDKRRRNVPEEE